MMTTTKKTTTTETATTYSIELVTVLNDKTTDSGWITKESLAATILAAAKEQVSSIESGKCASCRTGHTVKKETVSTSTTVEYYSL